MKYNYYHIQLLKLVNNLKIFNFKLLNFALNLYYIHFLKILYYIHQQY